MQVTIGIICTISGFMGMVLRYLMSTETTAVLCTLHISNQSPAVRMAGISCWARTGVDFIALFAFSERSAHVLTCVYHDLQ